MLVTSVFLSINWKYYVNIILFNWTLILGMCFQYYSRCLSGVLTYVWWVGTHKIHISNTEHSMWPVSNGYRTCDDPSYPIGESEHCLVKIVESIYRHRPTNAQSVRASTWTELHIRIMWKMMRINRAYNAQQNNVNSSGMRYVHRSYPNIPHAHTHTADACLHTCCCFCAPSHEIDAYTSQYFWNVLPVHIHSIMRSSLHDYVHMMEVFQQTWLVLVCNSRLAVGTLHEIFFLFISFFLPFELC